MTNDSLRPLVADGLRALKGGGRQAADAAGDVYDAATHPDLKKALERGQETSKEWRARVDRAMDALGVDGENENPVIEAAYEVSRKSRESAEGDDACDLGIIAAGQIALHYWVAAFGTLGSYLKALGESDAAETMSRCVDEAKKADQEHTAIAEAILGDA